MKPGVPLPPLRKVVATFTDWRGQMEELECGHIIRRKQDLYGPTNAARRRCKPCRRRDPAYVPALHDIRCGCSKCEPKRKENA